MTRAIRHLCTIIVLLLGAAAPLRAQGFATPEYYAKEGQEALAAKYYTGAIVSFRQASMLRPQNAEYHFLLGTALASDGQWADAREAFAKAVVLQQDLKTRADEWLARAPGTKLRKDEPGAPATPAAAPVATPAAAPVAVPVAAGKAFAVGDPVEIAYRVDEWFPGVVTSVDAGGCPYYRVRADPYGNGRPMELGYSCKSVRAPTGIAPTKPTCGGSNANCAPTSPPPLGAYSCTEQVWQGPGASPQFRPKYHGSITLLSGGRYRLFADGAVGRYRYDPATHRIDWIGAGMAGRGSAATYGLDGTAPEITIVFESDYTRRTGNAAPRWQCALGR
ncbi:MAG: tetratricopeptide repeat protein [Gemmatirosa sp.]